MQQVHLLLVSPGRPPNMQTDIPREKNPSKILWLGFLVNLQQILHIRPSKCVLPQTGKVGLFIRKRMRSLLNFWGVRVRPVTSVYQGAASMPAQPAVGGMPGPHGLGQKHAIQCPNQKKSGVSSGNTGACESQERMPRPRFKHVLKSKLLC